MAPSVVQTISSMCSVSSPSLVIVTVSRSSQPMKWLRNSTGLGRIVRLGTAPSPMSSTTDSVSLLPFE